MKVIGVISDTHGRVHERVGELFAGVSRILHAGDVGGDDVLLYLENIAPVTAVRGNMDRYAGAERLPSETRVEIDRLRVLVVHDGCGWLLDHDAAARAGVDVLVAGHTHVPATEAFDGLLHLNPGSASRPGSGREPTVALLEAVDGRPVARIVPLSGEMMWAGRGGRI